MLSEKPPKHKFLCIIHYAFVYLMGLCFLLSPLTVYGVYQSVYNVTTNGGMSWTGNTLGLDGGGDTVPGTRGRLGAFITNPGSTFGSYPDGTTGQWQLNNSTAVLDLPPDSTILHAELIWSGTWNAQGITLATLSTPINFTTPDSIVHLIAPRVDTAQVFVGSNINSYVRSADVTTLVIGGGTYAAGGIPGTRFFSTPTVDCAGWTLAVAYSNPNALPANISIYTALENVSNAATPLPVQVSGFLTPTTGPFTVRVFASIIEGDAGIVGDRFLAGPTAILASPANALSGVNNPVNNFFASQINTLLPLTTQVGTGKLVANGSSLLDTRGSFGNSNSNAITGTFVTGARQGYDITSVDATARFMNGQTTAFFQGQTTEDAYAINALGIQIQSEGPVINVNKTATPTSVGLGSVINYTVTLSNSSSVVATNSLFTDILPVGLTYNPNTFFVNGVPVVNPDFVNGVPIGNIVQGTPVVVQFAVTVTTLMDSFTNSANVQYTFTPFVGSTPVTTSSMSNAFIVIGNGAPAPVAVNDTGMTVVNVVLSGTTVLANDTGTGITVTGFSPVSTQGGSVSVLTDGTYSYTPPLNFSGADAFTYTITDVDSQTASATVNIIVLPLAISDTGSVAANTPLNSPTSILANDLGTGLTIIGFDAISNNGGTVVLNLATGFYTYTPPLNFSGLDSFNYTIQDSLSNQSTATVNINVLAIAQDDVGTTPANTVLNGSTIFSNDIGTGLTLISYTPVSSQGGSVILNMATGTYVYTPPTNFSGIDTFTYTVQDQNGNLDTATVTITVTPIAVDDTGATTANTQLNGASVLTNDIGTGLFISNAPSSTVQGGMITFNTTTGTYVYTPPLNFSGDDNVLYQIRDQAGSTSSAVVAITISPNTMNDTGITQANRILIGASVLANDSGTTLVIQTFQTPTTQGGTVSMNTDGTYIYVPPTGFSGTDSFDYTTVDASGNTGLGTITVFIVPTVNNPTYVTLQNDSLNGANVLDGAVGTGLFISSYDPISAQGGAVFVDTNGAFTYTPPLNFVGSDSFTFQVSDSSGNVVTGTVSIDVLLPSPLNFIGFVEKCRFLNGTDYTLIATWSPSADPNVTLYRIFFAGQLVATIPATDTLTYRAQLSSRASALLYQLTAVNSANFESAPVTIVILNQ